MYPVFVKRGNVLFLLKTPGDFLQKLSSGKIRPTDAILAQGAHGSEWVAIRDIREFQLEADSPAQDPAAANHVSAVDDILDRIRQPGFNLAALALGPFWYLLRNLPDLARKRGSWALGSLAVVSGVGFLADFSGQVLLILGVGVWLANALFCAWRADNDLNREQIERYHLARSSCFDRVQESQEEPFPVSDPLLASSQTPKARIFN